MMKKLSFSLVIVLGSLGVVSAQTGKNPYGSKTQNIVAAASNTPKKTDAPSKQNKTEMEQKTANKKVESSKTVASKPKAAMSLIEAQQ